MTDAAVVEGVSKSFGAGKRKVVALQGVGLRISRGELLLLSGRSGSGKTTLLSLVGALDRPDEGRVVVSGTDVTRLGRRGLYEFRKRKVGWVFQTSGLLPLLTAAENVALGLHLLGETLIEVERRTAAALSAVGMEARAKHRAHELSGGERQRVAIARALVKAPEVLLADEPTGQLDSEMARSIAALLRRVADEGTTVLLASHDRSLVEVADHVATIADGSVT
jgi:putative ABC transport system ATP-binding protein